MLQKIFPYVLIFLGLWYLPEIYLFTRSVSTDLYNEAAQKSVYRVEVKVAKPLSVLPEKFAVLGTGVGDMWVELEDSENSRVFGGVTDEYGTVVIESVPSATYTVRVGPKPDLDPADISEYLNRGYSILETSESIPTSVDETTVTKDSYIVPIVREVK